MIEFLNNLDNRLLYFALFVSSYFENIFPPMPGDTITVFGAYLVGIGRLQYFTTYIATSLGSILGFMTPYVIGLKLGRKYFLSGKIKFIKKEDILHAERWFHKYGYRLIIINRFLASIRSVVSLIAGFSGLNYIKVGLLGLVSVLVWNGILIFAGYKIGENWNEIIHYLKIYSRIILILAIVLVVAIIVYKKFIEKKKEIISE